MSAIPATPVRPAPPSVRRSPEQQVISGLPKLALVPTPAPVKGFVSTVIVCLVLFLGAFATVFYLNTQMVATAYEIQNVNRQINAASATNETLTDQVVQVSTPEGLRAKATELGMVAATDTRFLDLNAGDVVIPADPDAVFQDPPVASTETDTDVATGAEADVADADAADVANGGAAVSGTDEYAGVDEATGADQSAYSTELGLTEDESGVSETESGLAETATETQGY